MKAWSEFLPEVLIDLPGCPIPVAEREIRNAAIAFCGRSLVWRYECDPDVVINSAPTYDFAVPSGAVVAKVITAWLDGDEIFPKSNDELNDLYSNWTTETGSVLFFTQLNERELRLVPAPANYTTSPSLRMIVALKPSRSATGVDDVVYEEWLEAVGNGAKARLLSVPGAKWANQGAAEMCRRKFEDGIASALARGLKGYSGASLRVKQRAFI